MPEPPRSRLRQLLDRPDAGPRVRKAVLSLLGTVIASIAVIGALLMWHLSRKARLIREQLKPPRASSLSDPDPHET
ncbi:MAG: hypothetical protein P4L84_00505 [Isosphaeraceae bacterium]|nr:hypothetical protein [Isosphaeraceae bacterium]